MFKILIPVDGSPYALHAVDYAKKLIQRIDDVETTILSVSDTTAMPSTLINATGPEVAIRLLDNTPRIDELLVQMDAESLANASNAQGRLMPCEKPVFTRTGRGDPWKVICRIAEDEKFDLIVMGSTGRGRVAGIFVGSISNKVLHRSKVPVLIVRGTEE